MTEMESGTRFRPVLSDPLNNKQAVSVVMLSGKIYYELIKERQARDLNSMIAFIRIEELAPFPFEALEEVLNLYPSALGFKKNLGTRARGTMYVVGLRRCFSSVQISS